MAFDKNVLHDSLLKEKSELMRAEAAWDSILKEIDTENEDWLDSWELAASTYFRHLKSVKVLQHLLRSFESQ